MIIVSNTEEAPRVTVPWLPELHGEELPGFLIHVLQRIERLVARNPGITVGAAIDTIHAELTPKGWSYKLCSKSCSVAAALHILEVIEPWDSVLRSSERKVAEARR